MFPASLDTTSKLVSYALMAFAVAMTVTMYSTFDEHWTLLILPNAILPVIILFTWLYSPYAYSVTQDAVLVHRKMGNFTIPIKDIKVVNTLDKKAMGWPVRLMGNGGLFGYTGWYTSSPQGRMRWFVRQQKNYVVIIMNNERKYVLSPNEPQALVDAITPFIGA
ncbi:MAG: PH domain-containing protein [Chitinophagaceae bacterium]